MTLRVKLEIVPFGVEEKAYEIGRLDIFNKGNVSHTHCEYGVIEIDIEKDAFGLYDETVIHKRNLGPWELVRKVIEEIIWSKETQERNKKMTEQNLAVDPQIDHVIVEENVPEFLQRVAQKLEQDGEVLVQTEANVGTEKTIH